MSKGTPSYGKRNNKTHVRCRRCGNHSYHASHGVCASCGFGKSSKMRSYNWCKRK
ncbi:MAG TPA: 50S ribosomal protein L37e [Methanofastidiosum sp.]|nr:50S ribosomal protein L37e [Methanofastidiosum sp.]HNV93927.1 50S ribosomal protein L37e [Methanofastidiosum sp.]HOE93580.1 50S ribosomal protein L37e [Methanofastidiosum sp.]HOR88754.1 50S ribosomal protein L37e [Methanofastidiosum sp.]HOT84690.1 50S ribosomal protein L37e [Methanofastidiosum sp.]